MLDELLLLNRVEHKPCSIPPVTLVVSRVCRQEDRLVARLDTKKPAVFPIARGDCEVIKNSRRRKESGTKCFPHGASNCLTYAPMSDGQKPGRKHNTNRGRGKVGRTIGKHYCMSELPVNRTQTHKSKLHVPFRGG